MEKHERKEYGENQALDCGCLSKLDHWENETKRVATVCARERGENSANLTGAIIRESQVKEYRSEYIVPLCEECCGWDPRKEIKIKASARWSKVGQKATCKLNNQL
jgi:hypothetical protein